MRKKSLAAVLAFALTFATIPAMAFADEGPEGSPDEAIVSDNDEVEGDLDGDMGSDESMDDGSLMGDLGDSNEFTGDDMFLAPIDDMNFDPWSSDTEENLPEFNDSGVDVSDLMGGSFFLQENGTVFPAGALGSSDSSMLLLGGTLTTFIPLLPLASEGGPGAITRTHFVNTGHIGYHTATFTGFTYGLTAVDVTVMIGNRVAATTKGLTSGSSLSFEILPNEIGSTMNVYMSASSGVTGTTYINITRG